MYAAAVIHMARGYTHISSEPKDWVCGLTGERCFLVLTAVERTLGVTDWNLVVSICDLVLFLRNGVAECRGIP